jgi:hypothetical protein
MSLKIQTIQIFKKLEFQIKKIKILFSYIFSIYKLKCFRISDCSEHHEFHNLKTSNFS